MSSENKPTRNMKYNTMTPAEAKKYRYINSNGSNNCGSLGRSTGGAIPVRTASVSRKPRAPPLIVDHSTLNGSSTTRFDPIHYVVPPVQKRHLVQKPRLEPVCDSPARSLRRSATNCARGPSSRWSTLSHSSTNSSSNHEEVARLLSSANQTPNKGRSSTDSSLNLSFRSTLEYMTENEGFHQPQNFNNSPKNSRTMLPVQTNLDRSPERVSDNEDADETLREGMNTSSNTVLLRQKSTKDASDDSFTSAWSDCQSFGDFQQSQQNNCNASIKTPEPSVKNRLQSHLLSIKKFFRNPFSKAVSNKTISPSRLRASSTSLKNTRLNLNGYFCKNHHQETNTQQLGYSVSKLSLNRSQTPPICPPPLSTELKSMSYMSSYSNYDEFTRKRNEQNANLLNRSVRMRNRETTEVDTVDHGNEIGSKPDCVSIPWQLNSLPVTYERNLATVPEDTTHQHNVANSLCYGHPKQNWQYQTFGPRSTKTAATIKPLNSWLNNPSVRTYTTDEAAYGLPYKKTADFVAGNETLRSQQKLTNSLETHNQNQIPQPIKQDLFLRSFNKADCDSMSWQLNSLPVSYERNLAPVPEDFSDHCGAIDNPIGTCHNNNTGYLSSLLYWNRT